MFLLSSRQMKQCVHILLSLLIATTSATSGQGVASALKFGAFAHHFMHLVLCHGQEMGLKDYVELHYSHGEHQEQDQQEHENLPFQHHTHHETLLSPLLLFFSEFTIQLSATFLPFQKQAFSYKDYCLSHQFSDIWKPPKSLV
jgi:hypothetical protein